MRTLLLGLLGAALTAGRLLASTNAVPGAANQPPAVLPEPDSAVEKEFKKLMADDDDAQAEVDDWIKENEKARAKGAGLPVADLQRRIAERFEPIGKGYADFIERHPNHAKARLAYGSFLGDLQEEEGAREQWQKALALDPKDPAVYNNLANLFCHTGPVTNAFAYYAKASELNPQEPLYYQNLGDTVFVFRKDAMAFYHITEQQVYDKALALFSKALKLDPTNFPLATDLAQTYYGIKPLRVEEALQAWTNTLALAHDDLEREGVYIHFARLNLLAERFALARAQLAAITNETYALLKGRIAHNLEAQEAKAKGTNATPTVPSQKP